MLLQTYLVGSSKGFPRYFFFLFVPYGLTRTMAKKILLTTLVHTFCSPTFYQLDPKKLSSLYAKILQVIRKPLKKRLSSENRPCSRPEKFDSTWFDSSLHMPEFVCSMEAKTASRFQQEKRNYHARREQEDYTKYAHKGRAL